MKKIMLFALSLAMLAGCVKNELSDSQALPAGEKVSLSFDVRYPAAADSKVGFDQSATPQLEWTGNETMTLIFGKYAADGKDNAENPVLASTAPGVFSGTVTIPAGFTINDLQGIVIPSEIGAYYDFGSADTSGVKAYINMPVAAEQVQNENDVPNFSYAPFFCDLSGEAKTASADGSYTFSGRQLYSASEMIRFNVYGAPEEGEVLQSVTLKTSADCHVGTAKWQLGRAITGKIENGGERSSTVTLAQGVVLPTAASASTAGAGVWMSYMCKNDRTVTEIKVVTDKNTYVKKYPTTGDDVKKLSLTRVTNLTVTKIALDLAQGFEISALEYSTDGQQFSRTLPAEFSTLYVRTTGGHTITASELEAIAEAVKNQTSVVDLDLSQSQYESNVFPNVFAATAAKPKNSLKSIKFPSNITIVGESAFFYCENLESVDLTGIEIVRRLAFKYSGLKTLNVPSSVDSLGNESFAYLKKAESIYYNATSSGYTKGTSSYKILCNRDKDNYGKGNASDTSPWNNRQNPVTITIGPDVKEIPAYFFDTNARLTNLVVEAGRNIKFWDQWAIRAFNIERIEFMGDAPVCEALGQGADFAKLLAEKEGVIVCPVGRYAEFTASPVVNSLLSTGKYRLREKGNEDSMEDPVALKQYSADGEQWSDAIPETFTTLYARTENCTLTTADITAIKAAVDAQAGPVHLDLRQATGEATFPAVFRATSSAPDTKLKSIMFPSGTVGIATYAFEYYKGIESVDFAGFESISGRVFQYSGLKTINIPSSVKFIGNYAFGWCPDIESVYYNPDNDWTKYEKGYKDARHLSNRDTEWKNKDWNNRESPLSVTIGPDVKVMPGYCFDTNVKLTELIVEASNVLFYWQWEIRCYNIERIEFKAGLPDPTSSALTTAFAQNLAAEEGVVVVPDGQSAAALENAFIQKLLATGKYRLVEKSQENATK